MFLLPFYFCIILSVSSSAPCTSSEVFQASFWTMCWPTPLRPARHFLTQLCVLLLGQAFAATGSKVDVSPGSQNHLITFFLLLFAQHDLVRYTEVLSAQWNSFIWLCSYFFPKYFHCHVNIIFLKCTAKSYSSVTPKRPIFHENNNYSEVFGFWSLFAYHNYRNRRSMLQQLPHFKVIRVSFPPPTHLSLPDVDAVAFAVVFSFRQLIAGLNKKQ